MSALQALIEKYPLLQNVQCGVCIGDGWIPLVECLVVQIGHHVQWSNEHGNKPVKVVVAQVKEKFGGLRFYMDDADDYVRGLAEMAEAMSMRTCEDCGAPGTRRGGGWIRTLCDACEAAALKKGRS